MIRRSIILVYRYLKYTNPCFWWFWNNSYVNLVKNKLRGENNWQLVRIGLNKAIKAKSDPNRSEKQILFVSHELIFLRETSKTSEKYYLVVCMAEHRLAQVSSLLAVVQCYAISLSDSEPNFCFPTVKAMHRWCDGSARIDHLLTPFKFVALITQRNNFPPLEPSMGNSLWLSRRQRGPKRFSSEVGFLCTL